MEFHRDINQSNNQSVVVDQITSARVPSREFKPSLYKDSNNEKVINEQKMLIKHLFDLFKSQNYKDRMIFCLIYSNIMNDEKLKDRNIFSLELIRLFELRLACVCRLIPLRRVVGRYDFPLEDERVNCSKRPAGLEESMIKPIHNFGNNFPYNSKLITCKPDPKSPNDKYVNFRSLKQINKMEVLLRETPILSYIPPSCNCSKAISYRCHHCRKVIHEFYPCNTCDICVFCNIECYLFALDLYHRWECFALQRHMFPTYLFMAMRLMLIGMQTDIFKQELLSKSKWLKYHSNSSYDRVMACQRDFIQDPKIKATEKVKHYKNKVRGFSKYYKYIEKYYELKNLPVRWTLMDDIDTIILDVMRMMGYLAHSTDLFQHLMKCPWKADETTILDLQMYAGGMILRHYGEVLCNVIALPNLAMRPDSLEELEDRCTFIISTNVGRFHHSCEPNSICFLYNNEVIIRACEGIQKNDKILINYFGIEDSFSDTVRKALIQKMYFKCGCQKCHFTEYQYDLGLAAFKCPNGNCEAPLHGDRSNLELECLKCDRYFPMKPFIAKEKRIKTILEKGTKVTELLRVEKMCDEIYKEYNPNYDNIYRNLIKLFAKIHDSVNFQIYFNKYMTLSALGLLDMTKSLAKYNYFFLQYVLDMCRSEEFYDNDILNILIKALWNIKLVYMFYYNIDQVSIVTERIKEINPLIQHLINFNKNGNALRTYNAKNADKLQTVQEGTEG